jgi:hypothetical protein
MVFLLNNTERPNQGLGYYTPYAIYFGHTAGKKFVELGNING